MPVGSTLTPPSPLSLSQEEGGENHKLRRGTTLRDDLLEHILRDDLLEHILRGRPEHILWCDLVEHVLWDDRVEEKVTTWNS